MPTSLEQIRQWLAGEDVEGLPERDDPDAEVWSGGRVNKALMQDCPACDGEGELGGSMCPRCDGLGAIKRDKPAPTFIEKMKDKHRQSRKGGRYKISADGADAILLFGRHKGQQLTDMAASTDGREYLKWMQTQDFPNELKELARQWHDWGVHKYGHGALRGNKT